MRIIVVTNLYPPYFIGGYELACRDAVDALRLRGHNVCVLTSFYGLVEPKIETGVYRVLENELNWQECSQINYYLRVLNKEKINQREFVKLSREFKPDLIYIWNPVNISISLAFLARKMSLPVCFFVFDHWLSRWQKDSYLHLCQWLVSRSGRFISRNFLAFFGLKLFEQPLDFRHVQFASDYLKRITLKVDPKLVNAEVVHWGVDIDRFSCKNISDTPRRLLFVGQVVREKGAHTAIQALKLVSEEQGCESLSLTVSGGSITPEYVDSLKEMVSDLGLGNNVRFTGILDRQSLISLYKEYDILVFPSSWDEPFGIVLLEAMASGLAVVSTATGGNREILEDGVNSLIFSKDDAADCAAKIIRLLKDRELFDRIRNSGRKTVEDRFNFNHTVQAICACLERVIQKE